MGPLHSMLFAFTTLVVPTPDVAATVTGRQADQLRVFTHGLDTTVEGLVLALLGTCSVEREATREEWEAALKGEHLRISYSKPKTLAANVERDRFAAAEVVLNGSGTKAPTHVLVRAGDKYFALAKFDGHIWVLLEQRVLSGIPR